MGFLNKLKHNQFDIRVSVSEGDLFKIAEYKEIKTILSTKTFFSKTPVVINADPFLFVNNELLYLFYEEQRGFFGKGVIKMIVTSDLKNWSEPSVVLEESHHLSYPNVFQVDCNIFMIPESGKDNSIKLYVPNSKLTKWTYYKTLLSGKNFVDSSIVIIENVYYLFTCILENSEYVLLIYTSDSIDGKWQLHPMVEKNIIKSRNGGAVFYWNNNYYRPAQLTDNYYGEGLLINKILELRKLTYSEEQSIQLIPNSNKFYKLGGHHFSFCQYKGNKIIATDTLSSHVNFWEVCRRIGNKF